MISLPANLSPQQMQFIQQTYRVFLMSLGGMFLLGLVSYFTFPPASKWVLGILDTLLWIACGWFGLRQPIKVVSTVFVVITGLFLGMVARSNPSLFMASTLLTVMVFAGLTLYVHQTARDFSNLRPILNMAFWLMLALGLIFIFVSTSFLSLIIGIVGTVVFTGWILYDTQQIIQRSDSDYGYTPALGAFDLIMDIVGLRSSIQNIMSHFD